MLRCVYVECVTCWAVGFPVFFIGTSTPSMITRGSARIQSFEVTGHVLINQFSAGSDVKFLPRTVHEINPINKDI